MRSNSSSRQQKMAKSRRPNSPSSPSSPSPSMANLRLKLLVIVRRHEEMKSSFNKLKFQIKTGLSEAEDVFASLSIPLMKLVGLKSEEMAEEGRSSTIFMDSTAHQMNGFESEGWMRSSSPTDQVTRSKEDNYSSKASKTSKELIQNQCSQLHTLVYLLRQIETHVNYHQDNILQSLDNHQLSLQKLFQKSILHLSSIQQTSQTNEAFLVVTIKLLKIIFSHVSAALGSVQCGVEDLMRKLAEHMCSPMVDYVKEFKEEMGTGKLMKLVRVVEEMEGIVRNERLELEEVRRRLKVEKDRNLAVISRLKDAEENRKAMKEFVGFMLEAKKGTKETFASQSRKLLAMDEDQVQDEKLLWGLLKEKSKVQDQASPWAAKELLQYKKMSKGSSKVRLEHVVNHRPVTRSSTRLLSPSTPRPDSWPHLGSSPSVVIGKK